MEPKKSARPVAKQPRAHVREHDRIITREWDHVSSRDWAVLGAIFTTAALLIVLWGLL